MKTINTILIAIFFSGSLALAQSPKVLEARIDSIVKIIGRNNQDGKNRIIELSTRGGKVPVYSPNNRQFVYGVVDSKTGKSDCDTKFFIGGKRLKKRGDTCRCEPREYMVDSISVDSAIFRIQDGSIIEVEVVCSGKRFINKSAPIILSSNRMQKRDKLTEDAETGRFLIFQEVYMMLRYKSFFPDDINFTFDHRNEKKHELYRKNGINNILSLKLYTDALGLFGGKSNGIAITEANGRYAVGTTNIPNTGVSLFKNIGFDLSATKFDSKLAVLNYSNGFTRTSMLQKSWFDFNFYTTLISGWLAKNSSARWGIDVGVGLNLSEIGLPNTAGKYDTVTTTSPYYFAKPYINFDLSEDFDLWAGVSIVRNSNFDTRDSTFETSIKHFIIPQMGVRWRPMGGSTSNVFARIRYTQDWDRKQNSFVQFQFGYTLQLSEFVNKK
jgi:hypothetical protein